MRHPRGDGDGWARCARGHRHWGVFGAAGLLLWHDGAVLLQHRAEWSHHGGTWGILGGARNSGETAAEAAAREATEEAGLSRSAYEVGGEHVDDHGGWAYTTVLARPARSIEPADLRLDGESDGVAWVPLADLTDVDLHPGLAGSLARLRPLLADAAG